MKINKYCMRDTFRLTQFDQKPRTFDLYLNIKMILFERTSPVNIFKFLIVKRLTGIVNCYTGIANFYKGFFDV